jgi:hypothetical protein
MTERMLMMRMEYSVFEGEDKGKRVWMVLVSVGNTNRLVLGPL